MLPDPKQILATLLPQLKIAAGYAQQIQTQIVAHPEKEGFDNLFGSALSDADLSVQTFVEVTLLSQFPTVRFYGEEHEKSYNTKYFRAIDLGPPGDYLVTLDPIDGTRYYLDGHPNYQIILTVLDAEDFEAVLVVTPALRQFTYALRGQGAFIGNWDDDLDSAQPLKVVAQNPWIYLSGGAGQWAEKLESLFGDRYQAIDLHATYSATQAVPNLGNFLGGQLSGAILAGAKFIDGAALTFIARESGCVVSQWDGSPLPQIKDCQNLQWPALIIGVSEAVHRDLLKIVGEN